MIRSGVPLVVDPFNHRYSRWAKNPLLYVAAYGKLPLLGVVTTTTTTTERKKERKIKRGTRPIAISRVLIEKYSNTSKLHTKLVYMLANRQND